MDIPPSQVKYYPAPPAQKKNTLWWILGGGVILLLACCVLAAVIGGYLYFTSYKDIAGIFQNNPTESPAAEVIIAPPPGEITQPAAIEPVVVMPTSTTIPTLEATPNVTVNSISFTFPSGVAQEIYSDTIPAAVSDQPSGLPGEVFPEHTQFYFKGYSLSNAFHTPTILVYPAQEYAAMDPSAATVVNDLKQLLAQKPDSALNLPFLPLWNAGQMFHSNIAYISFKNGSGVRFLTMYAQAYYPVNNTGLFYTFQGLTDDGEYYIAAVLPVSHPSLPATGDEIPGGDFDAFVANIETYFAETTANLEAQPLNSFTPDISLLDAMFESFAVNR